MSANVLQILPRAPGTFDGVGDYALALARKLRDRHSINSVFVARETEAKDAIDSFPIFPLQELPRSRVAKETSDGVILHYVNYGFQKRGVPLTLLSFLKSLRRGGALLVIFHELFASGPPWRSEFWLRPLQKKIARDLARLADARMVSCESMHHELEQLFPGGNAIVRPVTSTWGEPRLDETQLRERDPHCWIICGGTSLLERSLRSFLKVASAIPHEIAPHKLFVVGGTPNSHVRALLNAPAKFSAEYFPAVTSEAVTPILCSAAFAWLDYFHRDNVSPDVLLKSSTFLALCAHGIIAVVPNASGEIAIAQDVLPGPFTLGHMPEDRAAAASVIFNWYRRHASSDFLASTVARQLQLA
jgi:hypothetical protein